MVTKNRNEIKCLDVTASGKYIGKVMKKFGITDKELAEFLNVTVQAVNKWRHGDCLPDIDNFYRLSQILDCSINELLVPIKEKTSISISCVVPKNESFTEADRLRQVKRIFEYAQRVYGSPSLSTSS